MLGRKVRMFKKVENRNWEQNFVFEKSEVLKKIQIRGFHIIDIYDSVALNDVITDES